MQHTLNITMVSASDPAITYSRDISTKWQRSTPVAYMLCRKLEIEMNGSSEHGKYAPWKVASYNWQK